MPDGRIGHTRAGAFLDPLMEFWSPQMDMLCNRKFRSQMMRQASKSPQLVK